MLRDRLKAPSGPVSDVTRIFSAIEQGDPQASEQLLPLVYEELRLLAAQKLAQEAPVYFVRHRVRASRGQQPQAHRKALPLGYHRVVRLSRTGGKAV